MGTAAQTVFSGLSVKRIVNKIPTLQNGEEGLKLLRARTHIYTCAKRMMVIQLLLTVIVPIAGAVLVLFRPEFRAHVAAASLAIVIFDPLVLDRQYKLLIKRAAKIAEQFDCTVLSLPWDQFTVGDRIDAEDIHAAARAYATHHDDANLLGWYPESVGAAPLHLARIICQRANLRYDSELRRSYAVIIQIIVWVLSCGLAAYGLFQNMQMRDLVLSMAPAAPLLAWAAREYYRQRDTADLLEDLKKEAEKLWAQAQVGACDADGCLQKSREFQNAIYARRATSQLVMPFLYQIKRSRLEDEMNYGAVTLLRDLGIPSTSDSSHDESSIARTSK